MIVFQFIAAMASLVTHSVAARTAPFTPARPQRTSLVCENRVAIRFQRYGRKKAPFYRLGWGALDANGEPGYDVAAAAAVAAAATFRSSTQKAGLPQDCISSATSAGYRQTSMHL